MAAPSGVKGFSFRRLAKPDDLRAAEELQRTAAGGSEESPVPVAALRGMQDNGGLVLGAFADIYLAGLSVGFLGWDGTGLFQYVHRFVVRPEYLNHGVGRRLAGFVRTEALQQGLDQVRGIFDPLSSHAAHLVVRTLGATPDRYFVHYYGQSLDAAAPDRESDRLRWSWAIRVEGLDERLGASPLPPLRADTRFGGAVPILESEIGENGLRIPTSVTEPTAPVATLEIPFDIDLVREHEPDGARRWRHAVRDAFRASLDVGYRVANFEVVRDAHERRSFYLLVAPDPPGSAAPATSGRPDAVVQGK